MKISEQWLKEKVDLNLSTEELAEQLTMAGLEVDSIEAAAPEFSGVVVAEIVSCEKHPDADKLQVCQVNINGDENLQIVCGAKNARTGLKTALATVGGTLPENFKIKKAKLRGVASFGMLCSEKELGLAASSEGIIELPADAPVGEDIRGYLNLNDQIIEVDLTPNRGDCLGMRGIAREVGVICKREVDLNESKAIAPVIDEEFKIEIIAGEDCPRYVGRVIKNIDPKAETPLWMKEKLRRGGIRSLSPTVDITNYVLLELGQPMHAFDLDKLNGKIVVRKAVNKESIELLDGQTMELNSDTLVIADANKAQAMAGVMGGEESSVTEETKNIFLESAFFTPKLIAGKARNYGLHTDSSHRFERGVDPLRQNEAIELATALLLDITGGEPGPVSEVVCEDYIPTKPSIELRSERVEKVLGVKVSDEQIEDILLRLGMDISKSDGGWSVIPPLFRFDVEIEADLIEEIGRVYGYNNIPTTVALSAENIPMIPEGNVNLRQIQNLLTARGYQEAVTYSFVCPKTQPKLNTIDTAINLANPISSDMESMRTTIWTGLTKAAAHNINRQHSRVRLFESGSIFRKVDNLIIQEKAISGIVSGDLLPEQWGASSSSVDFFDVKADVEAILSLSNADSEYQFKQSKLDSLHPGQTAEILRNGQTIGWLGCIHPALAKELDLPQKTFLFELKLDEITNGNIVKYKPISKFPSIKRDLAIVVKEDVSAASILDAVAGVESEILHDVSIFDLYRGKGIEKDCKSLAISLILRHFSRTLIDNEVDEEVEQIIAKLNREFGATLRN